jgi:hypothetical protein
MEVKAATATRTARTRARTMARTRARAAANDSGANGIARAFETAVKGRPGEHSRAHGLLCRGAVEHHDLPLVLQRSSLPSRSCMRHPRSGRLPLGRRPRRWARSSSQGEETASRREKGTRRPDDGPMPVRIAHSVPWLVQRTPCPSRVWERYNIVRSRKVRKLATKPRTA